MREERRPDVVSGRSHSEKKSGYRDLLAWQLGMELVRFVYFLTNGFPNHELFGLISQLRRAAVLVPSNIAEGYRRKSHHIATSACSLDTPAGRWLRSKRNSKLPTILVTSPTINGGLRGGRPTGWRRCSQA